MSGVGRWAVLGLWVVWGCSGSSETMRECQDHLQAFDQLRDEARRLFEVRAAIDLKRELLSVQNQDESKLAPGLRDVLARMRAAGTELKADNLDREEAALADSVDRVFRAHTDVVVAEMLIISPERTVTLQYPENTPLPTVAKWVGLREHRLFCGMADCQVAEAREPCTLIQLRPREHPGSAGLTVAFRRE